jgi:hypothetical protein
MSSFGGRSGYADIALLKADRSAEYAVAGREVMTVPESMTIPLENTAGSMSSCFPPTLMPVRLTT